jgi:penicillin-binding protein 2
VTSPWVAGKKSVVGSPRARRERLSFHALVAVAASLAGCSSATKPPTAAPVATSSELAPIPAPLEPSTLSYVETLHRQVGPNLTLDSALQDVAERTIRGTGRPAAVVAIEPDTGVVRAVFSVPGDRGDPLLVPQIPASTFKVFTALAGLESGTLTVRTEKTCTGKFAYAGKELECNAVHGRETVVSALERSCNSFFYEVGTEVDHRAVLEVARRFGFGELTGIEIPDAPGTLPSAARAEEIHRDPSSTLPLLDAIGHGEILVTLLQQARAFAVIANGGKLVRLTLEGRGSVERTVEIAPRNLAILRVALANVVDEPDGTAHDVAIPGYPYAGKTGSESSPFIAGEDAGSDTWFIAYAPRDESKLLVAARVEHAYPPHDAKHVVHDLLDAYRKR